MIGVSIAVVEVRRVAENILLLEYRLHGEWNILGLSHERPFEPPLVSAWLPLRFKGH